MLSIVVCSISQQLLADFKANLENTIGVPYELIAIDNAILNKSITHIYNLGASKAKFEIVCFIHEDIAFTTKGWGKKVLSHFNEKPHCGLIGVAGSKYKAALNAGWYTGVREFDCCNITHQYPSGISEHLYLNPVQNSLSQQVVVIDGVFMCVRRSVLEQVAFDEHLLTGFHFYDIDFSFNVSRFVDVYTVFDIDMIHFTKGGDFGDKWMYYSLLWHKNSGKKLPVYTPGIDLKINRIEQQVTKSWLSFLMKQALSTKNRFRWLATIPKYYLLCNIGALIKFMAYPFMKFAYKQRNKRQA